MVEAARTLFLRQGYTATTMEDIAALAGLTKRTVYNNYGGKEALFTQIVADVTAYAETFTAGLRTELAGAITGADLRAVLQDLGRRLALAIVRAEVVALRRLLIGESRAFPQLARRYFSRAPRAVLIGVIPPREQILACSREGVETFLARYGAGPDGGVKRR